MSEPAKDRDTFGRAGVAIAAIACIVIMARGGCKPTVEVKPVIPAPPPIVVPDIPKPKPKCPHCAGTGVLTELEARPIE